jgi:transcriptional regulator of aromatic amino acid metabolism
VEFNCASCPDRLLEFELFGCVMGSITGAVRTKPGLFEMAHRGTLFLDNVTELPKGLQAQLLEVQPRSSVYLDGRIRRPQSCRAVAEHAPDRVPGFTARDVVAIASGLNRSMSTTSAPRRHQRRHVKGIRC